MVYAVGKAGRQDWQHVYTAVTRGRGRVYVIAEEAHLRSAVSRNNVRRKTRLKHFLQDRLSSGCPSPAEGAPPSGGGPSTPPPAPPAPAAAHSVAGHVQASEAVEAFASPGGRPEPFSGETSASEDPSRPRGSKRTGVMADGSPSKVLMVGAMISCAPALPVARCSCWCVSVRAALAVGHEAGVFSLLLGPPRRPAGPGWVSLCPRLAREAASAVGLRKRLLCLLHLLSADLSLRPPLGCGPRLTCLLTAPWKRLVPVILSTWRPVPRSGSCLFP